MTEMLDHVLVKSGVVDAVARYPMGAESFGETPDGQVLTFPAGQAFGGMHVVSGALVAPTPTPAPVVRRLLPKSLVQERVAAIGKLEDVMTLLTSPGNAVYFARWFAPDWPNVFFDDAQTLAMLTAVGCTSGQITTIMAPP